MPAKSSSRPLSLFTWLAALIVAVAGLGLSIFLMIHSLAGGAVPGCAAGSGCQVVLASPWSRVLGQPVAEFATAVYAMVVVLLLQVRLKRSGTRVAEMVLAGCAVVIALSAVWFIVLQAAVLGELCRYCMAVHVAGLVLSFLLLRNLPPRVGPMLVGAAGVVLLVGLQLFGPAPQTRVINFAHTGNFDHGQGASRQVALLNGAIRLAPASLPHIGDIDAPIVLVDVMDYTCPFCRQLDDQLRKLRGEMNFLTIITPAPMSSKCNPNYRDTGERHEDACAIAKLMLTLWFEQPQTFARAHELVMSSPDAYTLAQVRALLQREMPELKLPEHTAAQAEQMILHNAKLQTMLGPTLPQLMVGSTVIQGRPYTLARLRELVAKEGGAGREIRMTKPE